MALKMFCDKCKIHIVDHAVSKLTLENPSRKTTIDLCRTCVESLMKWSLSALPDRKDEQK